MTRQYQMILLLLISLPWISACQKSEPPFQCTDTLGCVDIQPGKPMKIGILQSLTGDVASLGTEQVRGIELAVDAHKGKILGRTLALQNEDAGCSGEGGANAALKVLADPQTIAILGTTCSSSAKTAAAVMSEAGLTMISGNNSAPFLTSIGGKAAPDYHPGYFRTAPNEEYSGKAAATFTYQKLGIHKVATLNDGDIYTRGLTVGFAQRFKSLGGQIVLSAAINKGETQMQPVLTAVENSGAELLFFPLFQPEGNHLLLQARKDSGLDKTVLMSDGALIQSSFLAAVRNKGKGMYFVGPSFPMNPATEELTRKYVEKFSTSPGTRYFLSAYDSANLLFRAIEETAVSEGDGTLHIGRQALRDALYATTNFPGITGKLTCDSFGDCGYPAFNILRLDDPAAGIQGLLANVVFSTLPISKLLIPLNQSSSALTERSGYNVSLLEAITNHDQIHYKLRDLFPVALDDSEHRLSGPEIRPFGGRIHPDQQRNKGYRPGNGACNGKGAPTPWGLFSALSLDRFYQGP